MDTLTSNQYYGAKNKAFDKRAKVLHGLGYKYIHTDFGAMFVRQNVAWNIQSFAASFVLEASNRAFRDAITMPITMKTEYIYTFLGKGKYTTRKNS